MDKKTCYSLQMICDGKKLFIDKNNMNALTDDLNNALLFFSENHINVWKKINPSFKDAIPVKIYYNDNCIYLEE